MKNSLLFSALIFFVVHINAQPQLMNYQGVARGHDGQVLSQKNISLQIHVISGDISGQVNYSEIHRIRTGGLGVFSIQIGAGTPVFGHFSEIQWAQNNHFVKVEMDINGGNDFKEMGTTQLLSVPYAFHAHTANTLINDPMDFLFDRGQGVPAQSWSLFGNSKTNPANDKFGTTDEADLVLVTNNIERMRIKSDGSIIMASGLTLGGNFRVHGDSVIIDHNLFVGDTTFSRRLIIHENAFVGDTTFSRGLIINENAFVGDTTFSRSLFINENASVEGTTFSKRLFVKDNVADSGNGGFLATFQNTNNNRGDGINIRLGKARANNGLTVPGFDLGINTEQMNKIKELLSCDLDVGGKLVILEGLVLDGIEADIRTIGGLTVGVGNLVINFINAQLGLPLTIVPEVEVFPGFSFKETIAGITFGFSIDKESIGPYSFPAIPNLSLSSIGIPGIEIYDLGFWGIPNICLNDVVSNPLNKDNEFIRFSDLSNNKMGSIRAESVSNWVSNYLNPAYLLGLRGALTSSVDKLHGRYHFKQKISEAVSAYVKIGVEYSSGNGDYAEWLERLNPAEFLSAGDIVAVVGGKITRDLSNAEQVMAVSLRPIVLGNVPDEDKVHLGNNIAFMGQIPVKIMGPVTTGDYIVGNIEIPGYGVAINPDLMTIEDFKYAVGRSWDTNPDNGPKMVNTVVGVHNGDYINILKRYEQRFKTTEDRLEALENKIGILIGVANLEK